MELEFFSVDVFSENTHVSNFAKIRPVATEFFFSTRTDGKNKQTGS